MCTLQILEDILKCCDSKLISIRKHGNARTIRNAILANTKSSLLIRETGRTKFLHMTRATGVGMNTCLHQFLYRVCNRSINLESMVSTLSTEVLSFNNYAFFGSIYLFRIDNSTRYLCLVNFLTMWAKKPYFFIPGLMIKIFGRSFQRVSFNCISHYSHSSLLLY